VFRSQLVRKDDSKGRSPEILVVKDVLPTSSRDSGDIFQSKASKDVRATLLNFQFIITGHYADIQ